MVKRMLIDATHLEETRVVVTSGNHLEEFDFETSTKKQLKGNIYLAKVVRVEPSLQAVFVDFGGKRHGFLAFGEIHPDYYQIPIADKKALLAEQAELAEAAESNAIEAEAVEPGPGEPEGRSPVAAETLDTDPFDIDRGYAGPDSPVDGDVPPPEDVPEGAAEGGGEILDPELAEGHGASNEQAGLSYVDREDDAPGVGLKKGDYEIVGGDDDVEIEEAARRRERRARQRYRVQEVIKRRQILLVQVVKEERGNKGAALTTYLSLAGRYCVLMPNSPRQGGISRKIANPADRKRLKGILDELSLPEGMAVILRTVAVERSKAETKRDTEYLLRLWDSVRELTLKSIAPTLVYEEANLIKRSIRDLYTKDIDEVLVEGEEGYRTAKDFMRMLLPSHAKKVKRSGDPSIPLFHHYQVESQLDAMHSPMVHLKSGSYIVIDSTEALVAIDVNSGRATRERNIEETAYKTNLEAAQEIARQLRLRDLAGLIVIDFIDMTGSRNQHMVEKRLKEAMQADRARIQIGKISPFGLLELSRQRLRPSLLEASTQRCPHCGGTGHIRSTESMALHVLRAIEEEGIRQRSAHLSLTIPTDVALYIFNQKRAMLTDIEARYNFQVFIVADDSLVPPHFQLDRLRAPAPGDKGKEGTQAIGSEGAVAGPGRAAASVVTEGAAGGEGTAERRRQTRRRRPKRPEEDAGARPAEAETEEEKADEAAELATARGESAAEEPSVRKRRRRGKRGGRRRARKKDAAAAPIADEAEAAPAEEGGQAALATTGEDAPAEASPAGDGEMAADAPLPPFDEPDRVADVKAPAAKPKRRRRAKAGKPAVSSDKARGDEAPGEDIKATDKPAAARRRRTARRRASKPAIEAAEAAPPLAQQPAASAAEGAADAATEEMSKGDGAEQMGKGDGADEAGGIEAEGPGRPKRRGWWQRLME
ncbi:MAG: ribonuclease E/G [Alphaproteobacteria bacterium]